MLSPLPIDPWLPRLAEALAAGGALLLQAEPGAGKTTRVPPWLARTVTGEVWVLEPRRVAARGAARRVAEERGESVGATVGYQVRFDRKTSRETRVRFVTEGILTRRLLSDPALEGIDAVVFDEYHERSLEGDLGLALTREVQATVRPDLRIVVMSATLETDGLSSYLGGAPVIEVPGRAHPIAIDHLDRPDPPPLPVAVRLAFEHLLDEGLDGSVLVFVPGAAEIRACLRELDPVVRRAGYAGLPLHGDQPAEEQDRAIASTERRVVVATNIAEASVTVSGVHAVIDSGRARVARFDPWVGLDRLRTERVSQASATQRAGRAGRLGPGRCLRLFTEAELARWPRFAEPEVLRVDLSSTVLALKGWGTDDVSAFAWPTPPPEESLARATALLGWLGALDSRGRITELGRSMLRFPVPPRHARVLVEAERLGVAERAARWIALAGERDPRHWTDASRRPDGPRHGAPERSHGKRPALSARTRNAPRGGAGATAGAHGVAAAGAHSRGAERGEATESDLVALEASIDAVAAEGFRHDALERAGLDGRAVRRITEVAAQLARLVRVASDAPAAGVSSNRGGSATRAGDPVETLLRRALLAGHPDRVVRRHARGAGTGVMVGGVGVQLDPASVVRKAGLFVALDATGRETRDGAEIRVWMASGVEPSWLGELFPLLFQERDEVRFEGSQERVRALRVTRFLDLVLEERETGDAPPDAVERALVEAAAQDPARALRPDRDLEALLDRLATLGRYRPDLAVPARDDLLRSVLEPLAFGCRSLADLRRKPVRESLLGLLPPPVRRALEEDVPERIVLPSGQGARIRYDGDVPVLAVRLQELFGEGSAPVLGRGAVPLVLHLLAPSHRPVQITRDLDGFWEREYPRIRSELRRRYPKHAWPEDPRTATPSRPGKKPR